MANLMNSNMSIPQPKKPIPLDKKTIDYSYTKSNSSLDKTTNFLMEMLKFMPDYERKSFDASAEDADFVQYGDLDAEGVLTFGQVMANMGFLGGAYGVKGLQFTADNAADFQHLDGTQIANLVTNSLISEDLWNKAMKSLADEPRSYYDLMMTGINDMSLEQTFYVLTAMLESRTRVNDMLTAIFGHDGQTDAQRIQAFQSWYSAYAGDTDEAKAGFLQIFLKASQSFTAHIMPLYGQSDALYLDTQDKQNAQDFMTTLTERIEQYIATLSGEAKTEAQNIWNAWLNPVNMPGTYDVAETSWGKEILDKLQAEMDKIIHGNIAGRVAYRARYEKYKKDKEKYEEEVEDDERFQYEMEKAERTKRAEKEAQLEKMFAQGREKTKANIEPKKVARPQFSSLEQQAKQTKASTSAKQTPKVAAKAPESKPVKITTAAKPVKVNSLSKNTNNTMANKPVTRVRFGSQTPRQMTKRVLAVQSVSNKGRTARRVRSRPKNVWGKPAAIKS